MTTDQVSWTTTGGVRLGSAVPGATAYSGNLLSNLLTTTNRTD